MMKVFLLASTCFLLFCFTEGEGNVNAEGTQRRPSGSPQQYELEVNFPGVDFYDEGLPARSKCVYYCALFVFNQKKLLPPRYDNKKNRGTSRLLWGFGEF